MSSAPTAACRVLEVGADWKMSSGGLSNTLELTGALGGCAETLPVENRSSFTVGFLGLDEMGANRSSSSSAPRVFGATLAGPIPKRSSSTDTLTLPVGEVPNIPVSLLTSSSS